MELYGKVINVKGREMVKITIPDSENIRIKQIFNFNNTPQNETKKPDNDLFGFFAFHLFELEIILICAYLFLQTWIN